MGSMIDRNVFCWKVHYWTLIVLIDWRLYLTTKGTKEADTKTTEISQCTLCKLSGIPGFKKAELNYRTYK